VTKIPGVCLMLEDVICRRLSQLQAAVFGPRAI